MITSAGHWHPLPPPLAPLGAAQRREVARLTEELTARTAAVQRAEKEAERWAAAAEDEREARAEAEALTQQTPTGPPARHGDHSTFKP